MIYTEKKFLFSVHHCTKQRRLSWTPAFFNNIFGFSSPQDNARQKYVDLVSGLVSSESSSQVKDTTPDSKHGYETLQVTTTDNITKIMLNRPEKKNAITTQVKTLTLGVKYDLTSG